MKASTRIQLAVVQLQKIASLPEDSSLLLLQEVQQWLASKVANLRLNYAKSDINYTRIDWFLSVPVDELPATLQAIQEFKHKANVIPDIKNPLAFLDFVDRELISHLAVYRTGWSAHREDETIEAWYDNTEQKVVLDDGITISGDTHSQKYRPAKKSELLQLGLFDYHQDLDKL